MLGSHTTMSNSGSHTRPSQVHRDESGATQTVDASRTGTTQMDHRERARASHQEWRQSMSSTQHEAYLARRRAHARGKRLAVENVSDHGQEAGPSNRNRLAPVHSDNESISSRVSSYSQNHDQDATRVRLTHIRQLARSTTSRPSNVVIQNSVPYEMPNVTMNNHDEDRNNNEHMVNNHEDQNSNTELENNPQDQRSSSVDPVRRTRRAVVNYNCARDFNEGWGVPFCRLPALRTCPYCNARLFHRETFNLCCSKGNIVLPLIPSPPEMIQLFSDQTNGIDVPMKTIDHLWLTRKSGEHSITGDELK